MNREDGYGKVRYRGLEQEKQLGGIDRATNISWESYLSWNFDKPKINRSERQRRAHWGTVHTECTHVWGEEGRDKLLCILSIDSCIALWSLVDSAHIPKTILCLRCAISSRSYKRSSSSMRVLRWTLPSLLNAGVQSHTRTIETENLASHHDENWSKKKPYDYGYTAGFGEYMKT